MARFLNLFSGKHQSPNFYLKKLAVMRQNASLIILLIILVSSCSSSNKIFISQDDFKRQTTVKLNQDLRGFSDEARRGLLNFADYHISFKHFYSSDSALQKNYRMDLNISTTVRAYEIEPKLYISIDKENFLIEADDAVTKMYQQGGSTTTSETSAVVSEDDDNKEQTETSTSYTTSSSHNTFQLMHLSFSPEVDLLEQISNSDTAVFRIYIRNEAIDMPLNRRNRKKFEKYVEEIRD